MICQACGKKTATTHIKTVVNGKLTERHLCADCAREKGYGSLFGGLGLDLGNLLGGLMSGNGEKEVLRCAKCGSTFEEIARTGKVGCAHCYRVFRGQLAPAVQRIHGTTRHKGKRPGSSALQIASGESRMTPVQETPLEEKKRLLKKAVEDQEYERAAVLRDEIKALEQPGPAREGKKTGAGQEGKEGLES